MRFLKWLWREAWPPIVFLAALICIWSLSIKAFNIPKLLLPTPGDVYEVATDADLNLWASTLLTAEWSLLGLGASLLIGTAVAMVFAASGIIRRGAYPYAIFLQTVPIIAIAPLVIIWCGRGPFGITIVSVVLSVFPIITNATAGMLSVDRNLEELFQLHNARWWQSLFKLRLPGSVPYILVGLRIGAGASVIGAIVGEFFIGAGARPPFGLGYQLQAANTSGRTDTLFAVVLASTLLGVTLFAATSLLSRLVLAVWYDESG